jgi:hypothetical protein
VLNLNPKGTKEFSLTRILYGIKNTDTHNASRDEFHGDVHKKRKELGLPAFEAKKDPN